MSISLVENDRTNNIQSSFEEEAGLSLEESISRNSRAVENFPKAFHYLKLFMEENSAASVVWLQKAEFEFLTRISGHLLELSFDQETKKRRL